MAWKTKCERWEKKTNQFSFFHCSSLDKCVGERRNGNGMRLQWALYKCELQQNAMWIEKNIYWKI